MGPTKNPTEGWNRNGHHDFCMTKEECYDQAKEDGFIHFHPEYYTSKGCFSKNGKSFWGSEGSEEEMKASCPGIKERSE